MVLLKVPEDLFCHYSDSCRSEIYELETCCWWSQNEEGAVQYATSQVDRDCGNNGNLAHVLGSNAFFH